MPAHAPSPLRTWLTSAVSLLLSVVLHVGIAGPYMLWAVVHLDDMDLAGEEGPDASMGDGLIGDGGTVPELEVPLEPVSVALYTPPPPKPAPVSTAPVEASPVVSEVDAPGQAQPASSAGSSESSDERKARQLAEKVAGMEAAKGSQENSGIQGKPPRGARKACDPLEEVVKLSSTSWRVERGIVDYYASHLKVLDQQAVTKTMRDEKNKPYGVRVFLPRCSALRSGGLKNGDVITSVNGKKVATLPAAIRTWISVRNKKNIEVSITRKDGSEIVHTYKIVK